MISQLFNKQLTITHNVTNIVTGLGTSSLMWAISTYINNFTIGVVNSEIREVHRLQEFRFPHSVFRDRQNFKEEEVMPV